MSAVQKPQERSFSVFLNTLRPYRKQFIIFMLITGTASAFFVGSPFVIRNLINHLVEIRAVDTMIWVLVGLFALARFLDEWLWRLADWLVRGFLPQLVENARTIFFTQTLRKRHSFFVNANSGQIGYWVNDAADKARSIIETILWSLWPKAITFAASIVFLVFASWKLALLFGVWIALLTWVIMYRGRRQSEMVVERSEAASKITGRVVDAVANNMAVRVFGAGHKEIRALDPLQQDFITKWRHSWRYGIGTNAIKGNSAAAISAVAIGLVVWMYTQGEATIGDIALFVTYITGASDAIWGLGMDIDRLIRDYGSFKNSATNLTVGADERSDGKHLNAKTIGVTFDAVDFAYPDQPERKILSSLSFSVAPGEHVGIVGHSGAGKSTLVSLLLGLYEPTGGALKLNAIATTDLSLNAMRHHVTYVPQDTQLFNRSIRKNIGYGAAQHITDKQLTDAAAKAQALDFIQKLPRGFDSLVGERGVKLSGGQRQRIAIARAILSGAPLILLDEATSALDSVSEQHIQRALTEVMKGRTAIVIAHRLSTLKHLDRIIVLDNGSVAETSTHDDLLKQDGIYADLWRRQRDGFIGS